MTADDPARAAFEKETSDALAFMTKHYDNRHGVSWLLDPNKPEPVLSTTSSRRECRYCHQTEPNVSFRRAAHAIAESLGNKTLFVQYECDACNQKFGDTIENHLGNWSTPLRSMGHINGKRGVPSIKSKDGSVRFSVDAGVMNIAHGPNDPHFVVDEDASTIEMTLPRDSYRPLWVLKALTKSALNIIPESQIKLFSETIEWVNDTGGIDTLLVHHRVAFQYTPGPSVSKKMLASLFFRSNDYDFVPYCIFLISFGNVAIQMAIPSMTKDWYLKGRDINYPYFPMQGFEHHSMYGDTVRFTDDLSSDSIIKNSALKILFRYCERRRQPS